MSHWDTKRLGRVHVDPATGCHNWTGSINPKTGYGMVHAKGERLAHRLFWLDARGKIPSNRELDHTCRNRRCVNLEHLRLASHRQNVLSGNTVAAVNAAKTHCPAGHAYAGRNLARVNGNRVCVACRNASQRAFYAANRDRLTAAARARRAAWAASIAERDRTRLPNMPSENTPGTLSEASKTQRTEAPKA